MTRHAPQVSFVLRDQHFAEYAGRVSQLTAEIAAAGLDGMVVGDHISFQGGTGADGLMMAAALFGAEGTLAVETGIYLLPLRHPVLVARQLATIAMLAPGRFTFGVGIGGEDPHESEVCEIDPRSRAARTDEALPLVRRLLTGEPVTHRGRFFNLEAAEIRPAPEPPIPFIVGGRSQAALVRAGRYAEGWIGVWVSARRHQEAVNIVEEEAARAGRAGLEWQHRHQSWCFFGPSTEAAAARATEVMGAAYGLPWDKFARYTPCGRPEDVAAALLPFAEAGCRRFNLVADAESSSEAIAGAGEVRRHLLTGSPSP
jgi:alkanesulfonate monooxygenase SsuD/methylene tetrahydromethanopterin reductase-like flavin-dependent oxidoreductase (luciferase family)